MKTRGDKKVNTRELKRKRYQTTFGRFVRSMGCVELRDQMIELGCNVPSTHTIYRWIWGTSKPSLEQAQTLLKIGSGQITLTDILQQKPIKTTQNKAVAA